MRFVSVSLLVLACGRPMGAQRIDAGTRADGGARLSLRTCNPDIGDVCFKLTPAEAGLEATGAGATVDQFALRPTANLRGVLLVFFNGSGGNPSAGAGTPTESFYGVARAQGLHVLAVSYVSGTAVGVLCGTDDCFEPTRTSILLGDQQMGAASALIDLTPDEGVFERIVKSLLALHDGDPAGGWSAFLDPTKPEPEAAIRWDKVMVAGHSQGGGHAALIGKRQQVARVIMLAAPCDGIGQSVATWLSSSAGYKTDPSTSFRGLWMPGDTTCPRAPFIFQALGMPASARNETARGCVAADPHGAPLRCPANAPNWVQLLE